MRVRVSVATKAGLARSAGTVAAKLMWPPLRVRPVICWVSAPTVVVLPASSWRVALVRAAVFWPARAKVEEASWRVPRKPEGRGQRSEARLKAAPEVLAYTVPEPVRGLA